MSLESQAEKALTTFKSDSRPRRGGRMRYRMEFLLVLLWGMYRGWDNQSIAYQTGTHYQTVVGHRRQLSDAPSEIFKCPLLRHVKDLTRRKSLWHCEVCNDRISSTEVQAREHVASHFFSPETIALNGVMDED